MLTNFTLDINNEFLNLTFSEPVDPGTFNLTAINLHDSIASICNYSFVEEREGTPLSVNSIFVQLSINDLNGLKACWYKCIDNCRVKSNHGYVWEILQHQWTSKMQSCHQHYVIEDSVAPRLLNFTFGAYI